MKKEDLKKLVAGTKSPPPPDPETLKREEEKTKREQQEKEQEELKRGARGPKSNLVKRAEEEADKKRFEEKCRKAARATCDSLVMAGYTFLGPEWAYAPPFEIPNPDPKGDKIFMDEKRRMHEAYEDMFVEYGWNVIPPWIPVVAVTVSYGASRMAMPSVKERFQKGFWYNFKERLKNIGKGKEKKKDEHSDSGNDRVGENHSRGGAGGGIQGSKV